jgi:DNA replication protein DnaC
MVQDFATQWLYLTRLDFVILDELGYLPFAQSGGQLLFHLISRPIPRRAAPSACGHAQV